MTTSKHPGSATAHLALDERNLLAAGQQLCRALELYEDATAEYRASNESALSLGPVMGDLATIGPALRNDLSALALAINIIESGQPVAALSERGVSWRGLLDPAGLIYFAGLASPDDDDYPTQAAKVYEKHRQDELSRTCGRTTAKGTPCGSFPIYWPGHGRTVGCSRHLTAEEKAALHQVWSKIEADHPCPGCMATPGHPCIEDEGELTPVSGEWPRIRTFAGHKMHDVRLQQSGS